MFPTVWPISQLNTTVRETSMIRGRFNSSITRVRPFFQNLLKQDATGHRWIPTLLGMVTCNTAYADELAKQAGTLRENCTTLRTFEDGILKLYGIPSIQLAECFEHSLPPPPAFLSWLIRNPEQMTWPRKNGVRCKYDLPVQVLRERLFGEHGGQEQKAAQRQALDELASSGALNSSRKWWAFEGFSDIDCFLETDRLVLLIEGKRSEHLTASTHWYRRRNQLIRNLEVAQSIASGRQFGVILIAEESLGQFRRKTIDESLPHFDPNERECLMSHYLGCVTWRDLCTKTGIEYDKLPRNSAEAAAILRPREIAQG